MNKKVRRMTEVCISVLLGNVALAFAVAAFIMPSGVIMGGATGASLIIGKILPVETATIVLCINVVFLALGTLVLGKHFLITTVASSFLYPFMLAAVQRIPGIESVTDNMMLSAVFAGGLIGIAVGLVMRVGASTGGTDGLVLSLHKWLHLPVSVLVYIVDFAILLGQAINSSMECILYGILLLVIETIVLNKVMLLGQAQIQIMVISPEYEKIRRSLLSGLKAGVTMLLIETGITEESQKGVLCVIPPRKLYDAKELIQAADPGAFITITQINEVKGQGFSIERQDYIPDND